MRISDWSSDVCSSDLFHAVVPAPHTILKGVRKLPPGSLLVIEPDGRSREKTYWTLDFATEEGVSFADWQDRVLAALRKAVDRRLVADVTVGVLLSGGIAFSLIVGMLAGMGQAELNT